MADFETYKQMPFSLEAEQAVLGTVIIDSEKFADIADLSSEDFYVQSHQ
ncbi:MAG: replicative DNA helicase, partial [Clostridiales bacterium]|nr:replicative DNA helicase [Candidatus Coliplasma equi]